jgi:branched-chain amino acid transport system permease protein
MLAMYRIWIAIAIAFLLPFLLNDPYFLHVLILCFIYSSAALFFDLLLGRLGVFNFAFGALMGVGAYTSALSAINFKCQLWLGILLGGVLAVIIGFPVALSSMRLKGPYIAITTLALSEILRLTIAKPLFWLTRGYMCLWNIPPLLPGVSKVPYYYLTLLLLIFSVFLIRYLTDSKIGIAFTAIKEDEIVANCVGINCLKYKILGFAISSFFSGFLGGIYAHYICVLTPDLLSPASSFEILTMVLVGGSGSLFGPILGVFLLTCMLEALRPLLMYRFVFYSILMIIIVIFFPGGLIEVFERIRKRTTKTSRKNNDTPA